MKHPAPSAPRVAPTVLAATFIAEARDVAGLPPPGPQEIAIAGRSNVGKSTLLNRLAQRHSLARTSKTPGRTRGLVFFDLTVRIPAAQDEPARDVAFRLVDLPGYGYAQVAHYERLAWKQLIEGYVERREALALFLSLVDVRRGIENEERELYQWLRSLAVPHRIVATKVDKLSAAERGLVPAAWRQELGPGAPPVMLVSADANLGVDKLWAVMVRSLQPAETA